jgi:MoaA/NifB/PqqE/SkfB family radical SAM enzyme
MKSGGCNDSKNGALRRTLAEYVSYWTKENSYVLFGVTDKLFGLLKSFGGDLRARYIVDNDAKKQGTTVAGLPVKSVAAIAEEGDAARIIITNQNGASRTQIVGQLRSMGLVPERHFTMHEKIAVLWKWHYEKAIAMPYTELMVTSRCSLRCKNCGLYIPHYEKTAHRPLASLERDIEAYFGVVDYVADFHLVGGEPLLHPELGELLRFLDERYKKKYGVVTIVTNATVPLGERLLSLCKERSVEFYISNYSSTIPAIKDKVDKFIEKLDRNGIHYRNWSANRWLDLGSPLESRQSPREELIERFDDCRMPCRALYDGNLYYCGPLASAVMGGLFKALRDDYVDLAASATEPFDDRAMRIIKLELGMIDAGYVTFCQYCNGFGSRNTASIIAAEQLPSAKAE